jgi:hypothetical protein
LLYLHGRELEVENIQRDDRSDDAKGRDHNGEACSPFYLIKRTVLIFLLTFVRRLVIGSYLFNKGGELIDKIASLRADVRANLTDAVAYLCYAISLVPSLVGFSCHGSPCEYTSP